MTGSATPILVERDNVNDDSVCVLQWLAADRSKVEKGQVIVEVETSKANMEVAAPVSGFLRHSCQKGEEVKIGQVLGYVCDKVEAHIPTTPHFIDSTESEVAPVAGIQDSQTEQPDQRSAISPTAGPLGAASDRGPRFTRQALDLIKEWKVDANQFESFGLVRSQDVLKLVNEEMARTRHLPSAGISQPDNTREPPVPAAGVTFRTEKLKRSKRLEAKHLWSAYQNTLPSAVTVRCSTAGLHAAAEKETGIRADVSALIIFELARLLRKYPVFNAYYDAGSVNYYDAINIGFALDAGRGLIVPVIRDADKKSVSAIAKEMREFLIQYLSNEISVESLKGGTFTITDLSSEDVYSFHPLINQGQSAILAVCSEFQAVENQENVFNLILVFDHQLSEGREAARFLNELRQRLGGKGNALSKSLSDPMKKFVPPRNVTEETLAGIWRDVFGLHQVGISDSFLELGGHSLLAAKLIFQIQEAFHVELPMRSLFESPTIADLVTVIEKHKNGASGYVPLPVIVPTPQDRYQPFALSDIQQAYWIGRGNSLELGNVACHIYTEVDFDNFERERFELVLNRLIERHDMLRAVVLADGRQQILEHVPYYNVEILDLRTQSSEAAAKQLIDVRGRMSHQVLPSTQWPLFQIQASLMDGRRAKLHISLDLLILDAKSIQILTQEFTDLYRNPQASLAPLEISFRDYVRAESALQHSEAYRRSHDYWTRRLPSFPRAPELPFAKNPNAVTRSCFVRRTTRLKSDTWNRLKNRATRAGLTPPAVLLAVFAEVLTIWSKSPKFALNLTLFNRLPLHPQVNDVVGDFTSLNMLAVDNSKEGTFEVRARRIQEQLWNDLDHRYFSGIRVLRELSRIQGDSARTTMPVVFTSFLNLDSSHKGASAPPLGKITYGITQTPQVWLDNLVREDSGELVCNWDAVEELFPEGFLDDLFNGYRVLLEQLASVDSSWNRDLAENTQSLIPSAQLELRHQVNDTAAPFPCEMLHTLFLKKVADQPNQIAISTPTRKLTYEEVYRHACRIENELLDRGVKPNQLVAVLMEKGWEQVAAVLGIHFAGGAYLPIDAELPPERQRYLIEHGQVSAVLTQSAVRKRRSVPHGVQVLEVDLLNAGEAGPPVPRRRQKPEDLAYVIYTSGSTGVPKGVMVDHRGATNTVLDINQRFRIGPQDRVLALSRLSFDLSVYDIFGLLAAGGTIVVPSTDLAQDAGHWADLISTMKVTVWNTVPALMQLLVDHVGKGEADSLGCSLRVVMMSGDWIPVSLPAQIRRILPNARLFSLGGATEASIWSILYPIENVDPNWKSIPYGKPMLNQSFHVLNPAQAPCPVWVPGHLHIGGIGLAKGYWRDEQKTNASFIQDPGTGLRLYRTGDLGRYLPDGNIEFLGREDLQVKVQGYRIELGEIEVRLQEHQNIENCVVVVREDHSSEKRLVGYAIVKPGVRLEPADLREFLRAKLPEYMVPSAFVFLDRFPLTANGKVDRKALPAPVRSITQMESKSSVPRDTLELQLTKLWEKALGVYPVNLGDNFFDLGGDSLMAVRLFSELRQLTGQILPLSSLFQAPTVEKLADLLRQQGWSPNWTSLVPIQPGGSKPPFYCVHGAGGNVLLFRDLARSLGSDYPFYGLQARGLDGSKNYFRKVEDMAEHYLKEIRELQPEGPYYLGGFCMGGQVAYEMAQILRTQGEKVALLIMIDTYNFNGIPLQLSFRESVTHSTEKITFHSQNILRLSRKEQLAYLRKKLKWAFDRELERLRVKISNLFKARSGAGGAPSPDSFLENLNEDATFAYVPKPYPEEITIFKPIRHYTHLRDPQMGWGEVASGGLNIIELPVNPGGIFIDPYVQTLAEKLRELLDEAHVENTRENQLTLSLA